MQSVQTIFYTYNGEVKSYNCNQCSQNFNESEYLNKHMLSQSGKKIFICKQCGYYYNPIPGDLEKNMLIHIEQSHMLANSVQTFHYFWILKDTHVDSQ